MTAKTVLAISGALGYVVVAYGFPDWQVAVETAQVTAGIVEYPRGNPFYIYHLKLWTVLHHAAALLLGAGVSEITLSIWISGLLGMVTFQALAMVVYALSRDAMLAIASTVVIIASNTAQFGVGYPIFLLGTSHTYGAMGLSTAVLVLGLIGSGEYGLGLFLLGVAPSIHPSLGIWLAFVVVVSLAVDWTYAVSVARRGWRYFAAGCAVSAVSLAVHLLMARDVPSIPAAVASSYLSAFTALWDGHRQPVGFDHIGVWLTIGALALSAIALLLTARRGLKTPPYDSPAAGSSPGAYVSDDGRFLLRAVLITALVGIAMVFASWVPPDRLPRLLVVLMPTRLLNVTSMTFAALVIGLLGAYRGWWWGRWGTVVLLLLLAIGWRSMIWPWVRARGWQIANPHIGPLGALGIVAALFVVAAAVARWRAAVRPATRGFQWAHLFQLAVALAVVGIARAPVMAEDERQTVLRDRTNDLVFTTAANGRGLLLTGGELHLIQLRTRRPILLDGGGLDGLAYAVEAAPAMDRILRDVYNINLFEPPEEARNRGAIPPEFNRTEWQRYPPERWSEIRRKYNVSQVLVPAEWQLALPVAAQNRRYLLYDIPQP